MMRRLAGLMFLIGLFSQTQIRIIGSIAISELIFFIWAPFLYIRYVADLKRDKVTTALNLIGLAMVGCVVSSVVNHTYPINAIKGFATLYGFWASIIVFYHLLRKSPGDFKWYLLGSAVSYVLCTFAFQQGAEASAAAAAGYSKVSSESVMESGGYYWITRLSGFVTWPIQGLYLQCPWAYSIFATFIFGAWSMLTSASGRSAALIAMASTALIIIGGKTRTSMNRVKKMFWVVVLGGIVFLYLFKAVYSYTASHGMLGEEAQQKYETQSKSGKGLIGMARGGRGEVFMGGYACLKKPIFGYGPWPEDKTDILQEYMAKYGNPEDYELMMKTRADYRRMGITVRRPLPAHSCLIGWWMWYSVLGIPFWIYVFYLIFRLVRYHISDIPEFFGYFAVMLPTQLWAIFFSPFGARLPWAFFIAMILLVRTVAKHRSLYQMMGPAPMPMPPRDMYYGRRR